MNYPILHSELCRWSEKDDQRQKFESRILTFYSNASAAMLTGAAAARRAVPHQVETEPAVSAAAPGRSPVIVFSSSPTNWADRVCSRLTVSVASTARREDAPCTVVVAAGGEAHTTNALICVLDTGVPTNPRYRRGSTSVSRRYPSTGCKISTSGRTPPRTAPSRLARVRATRALLSVSLRLNGQLRMPRVAGGVAGGAWECGSGVVGGADLSRIG